MERHAKLRAVRWPIALTVATLSSLPGCMPRPRMCTASIECEGKSACVAGRCQVEKASVKPAVDSSRRLVVRPADIAYVKTGDEASGGLPALFALGKDGGKLFLRFSAAIPKTATIIEAYVVLRRSAVVDDDPAPISLHATRIVESWVGGSVSWALQPRSTDTRSPSTMVEPSGSPIVRVDVRELVRQWPRHDPGDQGIAIVADNETRTGTTFALSGHGAERTSGDPGPSLGRSGPVGTPDVEPYLELYIR
jgi:hypothetical protein